MIVLVMCDDYWHSAEVVKRGLTPLETHGFKFDFVETCKDILNADMLYNYKVIVNCKMNQIASFNQHPWLDGSAEAGVSDFRRFVEKGGGFLSLHAGNAYFKDKNEDIEYIEFIGNHFINHPPRCDVEIVITAQHAVTSGIKNFTVRDEHYEIEVIADDAVQLCTTYSESGGNQIGGYVRELGKGRLCVLTPGHILEVWENPQYRKMLINALNWCANK